MTNPPAKASQQPQGPSGIRQHGETINHFDLTPANAKEGNAELLSCLILVAPSGMTAEDREAWLRAAKMTLSGIPADLLARGCDKARRSCRFPSEIVPTILEEIEMAWKWRRDRGTPVTAPRIAAPEPEYVDPAEVRKLIRSLGRA